MKKLICVQYVQTLIGPQSKYHIKRLLIFTFLFVFSCVLLYQCV